MFEVDSEGNATEQPKSIAEILHRDADAIVEHIDNGLLFNAIPVADKPSQDCWRCNQAPAKTSIGLCVPCRDWLHEDDQFVADNQLDQHPQYSWPPTFYY